MTLLRLPAMSRVVQATDGIKKYFLKSNTYENNGVIAQMLFQLAQVLHIHCGKQLTPGKPKMIVELDRYRKARAAREARSSTSVEAGSIACETVETRRLFGNTVPKISLREIREEALRSLSPVLPDSFEDFNAREFIVSAYGLATQI